MYVCCPFIIFQNCSYDYSFGGSPRVRLGGSANASAGGAASAVAVDTQLTALPPRYTVNTTAAEAALVGCAIAEEGERDAARAQHLG